MLKRNHSIDLLNIIIMFMVLMLHLLLNTGALKLSIQKIGYPIFLVIWMLEILCYVAVNCFVLTTGYFGYNKRFKSKQIVNIYLTIILCSIIWIFLNLILNNTIDKKAIIVSIFPLCTGHYWYISTYIVLYMFSPFINKIIQNLSKTEHLYILSLMFVIFSILPTLCAVKDVFLVNAGQSLIWFVFLYLLGAYIAKHSVIIKSWQFYLYIYIIIALLLLMSKVLIGYITTQFLGHSYGSSVLIRYNSFFVLAESIALFFTFLSMPIKNIKLLKIRPYTLTVYIFTEHIIGKNLIWNFASSFINFSNWVSIPISFLYAIVIYIICILIGLGTNCIIKQIECDRFCSRIDKIVKTIFE